MKKYKTIFFDLDGTLVLEDYQLFIKLYLNTLAKVLAKNGYKNENDLAILILKSEQAMVNNDGTKLNEQAFWDYLDQKITVNHEHLEKTLNDFYASYLCNDLAPCATKNQEMVEIIEYLKKKEYPLILTTNSVFPMIANAERLKWNDLDMSTFSYVTNFDNSHYAKLVTYEKVDISKSTFSYVTNFDNSHYAKPNPNYYQEVLDKLNLKSSDVLMIGNDSLTDGAALKCGIDFYLVTDSVLNDGMCNPTYEGTISELKEFIKERF